MSSDEKAKPGCCSENSREGRRGFLKKFFAGAIGGFLALFPAGVGLFAFFDPLRKRARGGAGSGGALEGYARVASLDSLPTDGTPMMVKVVADRVDAWTTLREQPIGSIFIRRTGENEVAALNVLCPHFGCSVDFRAEQRDFLCPCHNSAFSLEGGRSNDSPSPRNLDPLDVQVVDNQVWVRYQRFRAGTSERIPEA